MFTLIKYLGSQHKEPFEHACIPHRVQRDPRALSHSRTAGHSSPAQRLTALLPRCPATSPVPTAQLRAHTLVISALLARGSVCLVPRVVRPVSTECGQPGEGMNQEAPGGRQTGSLESEALPGRKHWLVALPAPPRYTSMHFCHFMPYADAFPFHYLTKPFNEQLKAQPSHLGRGTVTRSLCPPPKAHSSSKRQGRRPEQESRSWQGLPGRGRAGGQAASAVRGGCA